jgi:hypothetical protein
MVPCGFRGMAGRVETAWGDFGIELCPMALWTPSQIFGTGMPDSANNGYVL